jgi:hypothetical protein
LFYLHPLDSISSLALSCIHEDNDTGNELQNSRSVHQSVSVDDVTLDQEYR